MRPQEFSKTVGYQNITVAASQHVPQVTKNIALAIIIIIILIIITITNGRALIAIAVSFSFCFSSSHDQRLIGSHITALRSHFLSTKITIYKRIARQRTKIHNTKVLCVYVGRSITISEIYNYIYIIRTYIYIYIHISLSYLLVSV